MAIEIERKFLVNKSIWEKHNPEDKKIIKQGYLFTAPEKVVRVRVLGEKGYITIKGKSIGISRQEFEYEIPLKDAEELIFAFCQNVIEKIRYYIHVGGNIWEVDEFKGLNEGLLLAEIELEDTEEEFEKPEWVLDEVSADFRYSNSNLANNPYFNWGKK